MDNLLLNFLVSIIGTLSSVASLVIGLMSANNSNKAFLNHTNNEPHNAAVEKKTVCRTTQMAYRHYCFGYNVVVLWVVACCHQNT